MSGSASDLRRGRRIFSIRENHYIIAAVLVMCIDFQYRPKQPRAVNGSGLLVFHLLIEHRSRRQASNLANVDGRYYGD